MSHSKLLVCLHIFYKEQIPYFIDKLKNIRNIEWDLAVSFSDLSGEDREMIFKFKPDTKFIQSENTGYDIWPFIKTLKNVNLDNYDYLMKLHTKNCDNTKSCINGIRMNGETWRNMLVDSMLKNEKQFKKAISILDKDKMAGMVCNASLISDVGGFRPWGLGILPKEMQRIGLDVRLRDRNMKFCAGTMFMARVRPFKFLVNADISPETFSDTGTSHLANRMAHCYERIFGFAVLAGNYRIKGLWTSNGKKTKKIIHDISSPLLKWLLTVNYDSKGDKCLTLFGINFKLGKS